MKAAYWIGKSRVETLDVPDPVLLNPHDAIINQVPEIYKVWRDKKEHVTKIVIDPWAKAA